MKYSIGNIRNNQLNYTLHSNSKLEIKSKQLQSLLTIILTYRQNTSNNDNIILCTKVPFI